MTDDEATDLGCFLLAQIADEMDVASAAMRPTDGRWTYKDVDSIAGGAIYDSEVVIASMGYDGDRDPRPIRRRRTAEQADAKGLHVALQDPLATVLRGAAQAALVSRWMLWRDEERQAREAYGRWAAGDPDSQGPVRTVPANEGPGLEVACRFMARGLEGRPGFKKEWAI